MPSYEVIGKHVFVLGPIRRATKEALFLRTSASIPLSCQPNAFPQISLEDRALMNASAIDCADPPLDDLEIEGDDISAVLANGKRHHIAVLP